MSYKTNPMNKKHLTLIILFFTCLVNAQYTQLGNDIDGVSFGDFSGWSCALSADGNRLCVGERFNNEGTPTSGPGSNFGQVRCYEWNGTAWTALGNDTNGEETINHFGGSLAINDAGTRYVAGAPGAAFGYVRVYELSGATWNLLGNEIVAVNENTSFGISTDINAAGNIIAVGENLDDTIENNSGGTFIYQLNGATWQLLGNPIYGINENGRSGTSVALSADGFTVVIGAPRDNSNPDSDGAVRVYTFDGTDWNLIGSPIYNIDDDTGDFGTSVDINSSGNTVLIGDPDSAVDGRVVSFSFDGTDWAQKGQALEKTIEESKEYGNSVSMDASGNSIVIGAPGDSSDSLGSITFFEYNHSTAMWNRVGNVIQAENTGQAPIAQYFGFSTAMSRDGLTGAAGDYYNQNEGDTFPIPKGSTRVFRRPFVAQEEPTAICQSITINLDNTGQISITADQVDGGSFDDQSTVSLSIDIDTFDCSNIGTNNVTLTVTDTDNNTNTCIAIVTVVDNITPAISCPINQTGLVNENCEFIIPDYTSLATTTDNCSITNITQDPVAGTIVNTGTTIITLTAFDSASSASCTFDLMVNDAIPPVAQCVAPFALSLDASGTATITAATINNNSTDNCGIATTSIDITSFSCNNIGDNLITLTVTDNNGLTSTCTTTVTITDPLFACDGPPVAVCQPVTVPADASCMGSAVALDFDGGSTDPEGDPISLTVMPEGPYPIGVTMVTLTVTDGVFSTNCTTTITVVDEIAPVLTCPQNQMVEAGPSCAFTLQDYTTMAMATDQCGTLLFSQNPSAGTIIGVGTTVVTIAVTDGTNITTCDFDVVVQDITPPTATCIAPFAIELDAFGMASISASDIDAGSSDTCGITTSINITDFTCSNIGANLITLTVTDSNGLISTCSTIVTITDPLFACNALPIALCQPLVIDVDDNCSATATAIDFDNGSFDPEGNDLTYTITPEGPYNLGITNVILTVSDGFLSATCNTTITVNDNTPPTLTCLENQTEQAGDSCEFIIPDYTTMVTTSDNCSTLSLTQNPPQGTIVNTGEATITITANDGTNITQCTFTLMVQDTIAPDANCQNITLELDLDGMVTITAADIDAFSTDNCGIAAISIDNDSFDCSNLGENNVTLTITDNSGNTNTCNAIVTIIPNSTPPIAACQNITVTLDENGVGTLLPQELSANGAEDICGNILSVDIDTFICEEAGEFIPVTLTVTNAYGMTDSCTAQVFIVDNLSPTISCPEETLIVAGITPFEVPDFSETNHITISDNCSTEIIYEQDPPAGTLLEEAETTINVTITDPSGNSVSCSFDIFVDPSLSTPTETNPLNNINLYPNPTEGIIHISNPNESSIKQVSLYDISGRLVRQWKISAIMDRYRFNLKDVASASYFLVVESNVAQKTFQILRD